MVEVEICVADPAGVAAASLGGADRVELCCALEVGGLTPSLGAVQEARDAAGELFVTVLIRPRPGDFVYSASEAATLLRDVAALTAWADSVGWGRMGFTVGALTPDGDLDEPLLRRILQRSGRRPVVFHKAFDTVSDPFAALERLHAWGVESVLASGGGRCVDHLDRLRELVERGPLPLTAAGGVRPENVCAVAATGVRRVHLRAPREVRSASRVASAYDEGTRDETDAALVRETVTLLRG